jgi:hypothetical protein
VITITKTKKKNHTSTNTCDIQLLRNLLIDEVNKTY